MTRIARFETSKVITCINDSHCIDSFIPSQGLSDLHVLMLEETAATNSSRFMSASRDLYCAMRIVSHRILLHAILASLLLIGRQTTVSRRSPPVQKRVYVSEHCWLTSPPPLQCLVIKQVVRKSCPQCDILGHAIFLECALHTCRIAPWRPILRKHAAKHARTTTGLLQNPFNF